MYLCNGNCTILRTTLEWPFVWGFDRQRTHELMSVVQPATDERPILEEFQVRQRNNSCACTRTEPSQAALCGNQVRNGNKQQQPRQKEKESTSSTITPLIHFYSKKQQTDRQRAKTDFVLAPLILRSCSTMCGKKLCEYANLPNTSSRFAGAFTCMNTCVLFLLAMVSYKALVRRIAALGLRRAVRQAL